MNRERPTIDEAVALMAAGKGVLSYRAGALRWLFMDSRGRGHTHLFPGIWTRKSADAAIAAARARAHLTSQETA